jgi:hypothetical protein
MSAHRSAILAIAATVGVALLVGALEWNRRNPSAPPTPATAPAARPGVLQVTNAVRSLKLVTWQFETTINAESMSDKWYGNAVASVRAPVRYQYGVNLENMRREDIFVDTAGYTFIVPAPERISVEVNLAELNQTLQVSGARWKGQNQDQIDQARRRLADLAQTTQLSPADVTRLRDVSRKQVEQMLRNVIGADPSARVTVRFAE